MPRYIVLAQSELTARALVAWRDLLLPDGETTEGWGLYDETAKPKPIVVEVAPDAEETGVLLYESLMRRLEEATGLAEGYSGRSDIVVMVDGVQPNRLSAVSDTASWENLIAMLILTFPEIRWAFGRTSDGNTMVLESHQLSAMVLPRREPLFDPTGLRQFVIGKTTGNYIKLNGRKRHSVVLEDEIEFAYFHAYCCYRFGYTADIVTTWSLARSLLSDESLPSGVKAEIYIEDMRLRYADKPNDVHLSELDTRYRILKGLMPRSEPLRQCRALVTTGQGSAGDQNLVEQNAARLNEICGRKGLSCSTVYKPAGGVLDLWSALGRFRGLRNRWYFRAKTRPGNADGFVWPPAVPDSKESTHPEDGHSAPGKIALIADHLIARSKTSSLQAGSPVQFYRASVLACDASELLAGHNPTSTLAAVSLRHVAEAKAECAFMGSGYRLNVARRIKEIRLESNLLGKWFRNTLRASLSTRITILNSLSVAFRDAGQFDEESECLGELRWVNRRLVLVDLSQETWHSLLSPLSFSSAYSLLLSLPRLVANVLLLYCEVLIKDFAYIVFACVAWTGIIWSFALHDPTSQNNHNRAASLAVGAFFGGQTAAPEAHHIFRYVASVGVVLGVLHLGIFLSYLYSRVSRR